MKAIVMIMLLVSFSGLGQESFEYLKKASLKLKKGKASQASRLIDKAEIISDCTCGSCVVSKFLRVTQLRTQIALKEGDYIKARTYIDSFDWSMIYTPLLDSLFWLSYQQQYGKDSLSRMIDYGISNAYCQSDSNRTYNVYLPLQNQDTLIFAPSLNEASISANRYSAKMALELWQKAFRASNTYIILKNNGIKAH